MTGFDPAYKNAFSALSIIALTLFNMFSLNSSKQFANISTVLKIIGIYGLLVVLVFLGDRAVFDGSIPISEIGSSEKAKTFHWASAFVGVLWSYTGWHYASFVTSDAENPKRNVPLALIIGTLVVTLSYVLVSIGYLKVMSIDELVAIKQMDNPPTLAVVAAEKILPGIGGIATSILISLSVFGCAGLYVLATPRIIKQMSNEGLFFKIFGTSHPKFGVPLSAILLQSMWAIVLVFLWGGFEDIINYVTITEWFFLMLAAVGIFVFRIRKSGNNDGGFKTPLYPLLPLIFIEIVHWFVINNVASDNPAAYFGLLVIPIGAVVYFIYGKLKKS
jgi:APA family basic amino acid/polyamine antiporter